MLAAGRSNQAIARELVVTLDTVKSMWATSWASSARLTAPSPWPGPANLASSPDAPPVPPADSGTRCRAETGRQAPSGALAQLRVIRSPARSLHPHDGQAQTPGQVTPWCPVPTEDSTRHSPFGRCLARRIFLVCEGRNAHRKKEAQWPPSSPTRPTAAPAWLRDQGFSDIAEGTVYALLIRIEQRGLVDVAKVPSEKGPPRKVYSLNAQGREYLEEFWRTWSFLTERLEQLHKGGR